MEDKASEIPEMSSYDQAAEFWDTHSIADYWDKTEPADLEISNALGHRFLVPIDAEVMKRVRRTATRRGVSIESLVNLLIEQRLSELG